MWTWLDKMFKRFLFYLKCKNLPLGHPKVPVLFSKSASLSLPLAPSSIPCFSVLILSSICTVSYAVGVQRKCLILCMKFMDSFLQEAKIWFVVSVIKAVNLKNVIVLPLVASIQGETRYFESSVTLVAISLPILKIAVFCFKSMNLLLIMLRRQMFYFVHWVYSPQIQTLPETGRILQLAFLLSESSLETDWIETDSRSSLKCIYIFMYTYIYIQIEGEKDNEKGRHTLRMKIQHFHKGGNPNNTKPNTVRVFHDGCS